ESERGVRELFKKAKQAAPCILFLDELDAMAPIRTFSEGDSNVAERVISQMLTEMDGIEELRDVIVLAATNRIDLIDPALLRPGRFDLHLQIPAPGEAARQTIFEIHTKDRPIASDVDLTALAQKTKSCVGADIELICRKATMLAIKEFLASYDGKDKDSYAKLQIRMKHFDEAINSIL
ncbi:MAG: AAA family ATPase, partial [Candidatus Poribacteria bacterium]